MFMPAAVAKWQAAPGQDQDTVCSTSHQEAAGAMTLLLGCVSLPWHACDMNMACSWTIGGQPKDASLYTECFVYQRSCISLIQTCHHSFRWRTCRGICHSRSVLLCRLLLASIKVCPASVTAKVAFLALAYCIVTLCHYLYICSVV